MQGLQLFLARFYIKQVIRPDFRQLLHCIAGNQSENTLLLPNFIGLVAKIITVCVCVTATSTEKKSTRHLAIGFPPSPPPSTPCYPQNSVDRKMHHLLRDRQRILGKS